MTSDILHEYDDDFLQWPVNLEQAEKRAQEREMDWSDFTSNHTPRPPRFTTEALNLLSQHINKPVTTAVDAIRFAVRNNVQFPANIQQKIPRSRAYLEANMELEKQVAEDFLHKLELQDPVKYSLLTEEARKDHDMEPEMKDLIERGQNSERFLRHMQITYVAKHIAKLFKPIVFGLEG